MNIKRIAKHLLMTDWQAKKCFPPATLSAIEKAIKASEAQHAGEIRFVVEAALDGAPLFKQQSAKARAIDVFSHLRIWDTEHNNGLLIYVLLAEHAVEIVADRGISAKVEQQDWQTICRAMESDFKHGNFKGGVVMGIASVTQHLEKHFPIGDKDKNELSNAPLLM